MSAREEDSIEDAWTKENLQKLLAAMKTSFPEQHSNQSYVAGLKAMDWKKVAFSPFSPEDCREMWKEILQPIRKMRSLTELIDEAEDAISKLKEELQHKDEACTKQMLKANLLGWRRKKRTTSASFCGEEREGPPPRPPMSGYNLFCHEQKQVLSNVNYLSECAKKWQNMPKEQKDRYSIRRKELQQQYVRKLNKYLKNCKYLPGKHLENRSKIQRIPSDSEDDVLVISSDEQEEVDSEEEHEEEDDDEKITFDMY